MKGIGVGVSLASALLAIALLSISHWLQKIYQGFSLSEITLFLTDPFLSVVARYNISVGFFFLLGILAVVYIPTGAGKESPRRTPITYLITGLAILLALLAELLRHESFGNLVSTAAPRDPNVPATLHPFIASLGFIPEKVFADWTNFGRAFSASLLSCGPFHLASNAILFVVVGRFMESVLGWHRWLGLLLLCVAAGYGLELLTHSDPDIVTGSFSILVCAALGGLWGYDRKSPVEFAFLYDGRYVALVLFMAILACIIRFGEYQSLGEILLLCALLFGLFVLDPNSQVAIVYPTTIVAIVLARDMLALPTSNSLLHYSMVPQLAALGVSAAAMRLLVWKPGEKKTIKNTSPVNYYRQLNNRLLQKEALENPYAAKEFLIRKAFTGSTVLMAEFYSEHVFHKWPDLRLHPGDETTLARGLVQQGNYLPGTFLMKRLIEESIAADQTNWEMLVVYLETILRHLPPQYPATLEWLSALKDAPPLMRQKIEIDRIRNEMHYEAYGKSFSEASDEPLIETAQFKQSQAIKVFVPKMDVDSSDLLTLGAPPRLFPDVEPGDLNSTVFEDAEEIEDETEEAPAVRPVIEPFRPPVKAPSKHRAEKPAPEYEFPKARAPVRSLHNERTSPDALAAAISAPVSISALEGRVPLPLRRAMASEDGNTELSYAIPKTLVQTGRRRAIETTGLELPTHLPESIAMPQATGYGDIESAQPATRSGRIAIEAEPAMTRSYSEFSPEELQNIKWSLVVTDGELWTDENFIAHLRTQFPDFDPASAIHKPWTVATDLSSSMREPHLQFSEKYKALAWIAEDDSIVNPPIRELLRFEISGALLRCVTEYKSDEIASHHIKMISVSQVRLSAHPLSKPNTLLDFVSALGPRRYQGFEKTFQAARSKIDGAPLPEKDPLDMFVRTMLELVPTVIVLKHDKAIYDSYTEYDGVLKRQLWQLNQV